jgi:hypothetical protein
LTRHSHHTVVFTVAIACMMLGGAVAVAATTAGTAALAKLLPRAGEMPGFTPAGPVRVASTIAQDVAADPPVMKKADAANLRKDGFRVEVYQSQVANAKEGGVAGVVEFRSAAGAAAYRRYDFSTISEPGPVSGSTAKTRYVPFKVPSVPGAEGAAQISRTARRSAAANVQWIEGSCVIELGDDISSDKPDTAAVVTAAQNIDKRTKGACTS